MLIYRTSENCKSLVCRTSAILKYFCPLKVNIVCFKENILSEVHLNICSRLKGDSNPNDKYVLSERALLTMNFDTDIIEIG